MLKSMPAVVCGCVVSPTMPEATLSSVSIWEADMFPVVEAGETPINTATAHNYWLPTMLGKAHTFLYNPLQPFLACTHSRPTVGMYVRIA